MLWFPFILWPILNKIVSFNTIYTNPKIINNFLSVIHSVGFVSINAIYILTKETNLLYTCILFSASYFVWDGYYSFIKFDKPNYIWIIHHIGSLIILDHIYNLLEYTTYPLILHCFTLAEVSNLPTYYIYHRLKTLELTNITTYKIYQIIWFSYFRIWVFSNYIVDTFYLYGPFINCILYMFYFMGIYWTIGQIKGVYGDFKYNQHIIQKKNE